MVNGCTSLNGSFMMILLDFYFWCFLPPFSTQNLNVSWYVPLACALWYVPWRVPVRLNLYQLQVCLYRRLGVFCTYFMIKSLYLVCCSGLLIGTH